MSFIGIICTSKQESTIKKILNDNLKNANIIILRQDTIENFKNITFETIAVFSSQIEKFSNQETVIKIIEKAKYFVMNADEPISSKLLERIKTNVITYGFNTKSTVTASSVKEDSILICLQRNIQNYIEKQLEPQEIFIPLTSYKVNTSIIMGIVSILLIYGKRELIIE